MISPFHWVVEILIYRIDWTVRIQQ